MPIRWSEGGALDTGCWDATQQGWNWDFGGGPEPTHHTGLWLSTCHQQLPVSSQMCSSS